MTDFFGNDGANNPRGTSGAYRMFGRGENGDDFIHGNDDSLKFAKYSSGFFDG